jgi:small subunit ribosomal protein S2
MPRKKKTETEEITKAEIKEEMKQEAAIAQDIAEEQIQEAEKPKKKKEIKKLSETELKKVMTDTKETLVPLTDYIACSIHLGTKVITPDMRKFVYKRRADGLAVLNTNLIDDKLREAIEFLKDFEAKDIFIACKREAGWPAVEKFSEVTGIRFFTKKYPAGIITNLTLETFFEPKLAIICDPWVDKNALHDSNLIDIPVLGICDTNNYAIGVTKVIAGNNKSRKSIGLVLFILAREYLKANGKSEEAKALNIEDFTGKLEEQQQMEERSMESDSKPAVAEGV